MDFEAVCAWMKTSGDVKIWLRNPSFQVDVIGAVSGSTWLITIMYFPLALAIGTEKVLLTANIWQLLESMECS